MSLSAALSIAQSALANNAAQSAVLSKNIANVSNTNYSLETVGAISQISGGVVTGPTQRATNNALLVNLLDAQSASSAAQSLSNGLTQIANTLGLDSAASTTGTAATDTSPATAIGALSTALQAYAAQPDDDSLATAAVSSAQALATNLNQASATVQQVREQADGDIASAVSTVNSLLSQFTSVNNAIIAGTATGTDTSDAQDTRDGILKQLSNEIGITTVRGSNGGTSIYTDSGATLFETTPRAVSFTPTSTFTAGTMGNAVTVDGVPVTGASAVLPIQGGAIAGLAQLRDTAAPSYQNQLDQIASGLIGTFSESDQTGGNAPTEPGLFTATGLTGMPTGVTGLAASITVNAAVDPTQGGVATRLRDGGINDPTTSTYVYNTSGDAGYSTRLSALSNALSATRSFDATTGAIASGSLQAYAASSVSAISAARQTATTTATNTSADVTATTTALSNGTGVNLDDQLSNLLDIEHAYQASAQILNTVGTLYTSLLQAFN